MSIKASGGSPVVYPQRYQTVPVALISVAEQQDRCLKHTELQELGSFFSSGNQRLEIAETLTRNADEIVAAGANRIFVGGSPMAYLEKPQDPVGLPGSGYYVAEDYLTAARKSGVAPGKERLNLAENLNFFNPLSGWWERARTLLTDREPLPGGFRFINISRYGPIRMKRSMRDLAWFLRYVTFAIVAGDDSILKVNVRGLRGVIPEDVTEATVVALKEMQRLSLSYFPQNAEASELIKQSFETLITEYLAEKPSVQLRVGVSNEQQGLVLPQSYAIAAEHRLKFVIKSVLSETEKQAAIKAAYRQVFERDITATYDFPASELESQVKGGQISTKEFIRRLGKSRLYRRLFYEPFTISRVIELAMRHFLGRGLSSLAEFQGYFAIITKGGLHKLIDALVDSSEYADYFGEETVPYLRGLGQEAQECCNWGPQLELFKYSAPVRKVPQFLTLFGKYQKPLPNQHPYGSGNDPLEIQFGAIFPVDTLPATTLHSPAPFGKDNRRILISSEGFGQVPGYLGRLMKLEQTNHRYGQETTGSSPKLPMGLSVSLTKNSPSAVIEGAYRQIFGRDVFAGQRITSVESELLSGEITMREFIRQLAKSKLFRKTYWESLYITKAIEYIHRRLLGRPTYGREEMNRYYDICANQGFYALIDEIIDSPEYIQAFGEDTVPYERYVTPRGLLMRQSSVAHSVNMWEKSLLSSPSELDRFVPNNRNGLGTGNGGSGAIIEIEEVSTLSAPNA
ncbi:phycobilisome rod-core linker polypeptide [Calothrix sp. PCC 7507]|uniref:phycobilisome rod-core linker polypeptide n=1 Tax=Calothrix sp. PCC 7507 TaxID=99598 RepID=UPI00029EDA79|nr:phycobilisome rod-core linker polypeptide [Calothrix sp. PCC 7507]AFY30759.1 Phycobilisome linker polypeptide [Calothrix sp. PCC 7507]